MEKYVNEIRNLNIINDFLKKKPEIINYEIDFNSSIYLGYMLIGYITFEASLNIKMNNKYIKVIKTKFNNVEYLIKNDFKMKMNDMSYLFEKYIYMNYDGDLPIECIIKMKDYVNNYNIDEFNKYFKQAFYNQFKTILMNELLKSHRDLLLDLKQK